MTIEFLATAIAGIKMIVPSKILDPRGSFSEIYRQDDFAAAGLGTDFVQENHSLSADAGTVRGLHFQADPMAQHKLVRVSRGRVFDVAVDLRASSPTYGRHVSAELSAENQQQMFVPVGFAHGFCTLEPHTEVVYKVSQYYAPEHDRGIAWNDPALAIAWPIDATKAILSERDRRLPGLRDIGHVFD
jgi:dTDP-4-dehydrorhamnose 3,5-epimerase